MWDDLTPEFRELYRRATDILPEDYDTFHISPSGKFKIYYSTSGMNAVNLTDTMGYGANDDPSSWHVRSPWSNGVPDYIDETAFALDSAWAMLVDRFGFIEPINAPDADGATAHYSVLISYLYDYYGVTWPYARQTTGAPGFSSYIEINSDWSDWDDLGYHLRPYDAVRVTCAHELFHAVQYAMVHTIRGDGQLDNLSFGWLEGSAVLMEDVAFPEVKDYIQYIGRFFTNPRMSFFDNSNNMYANSILLKYLYEKTNPEDSIGFVKAIQYNSYNERTLAFHRNIERVSQNHAGKSWAETLNGFHAESYFTGSRARRPWAFVNDAELMRAWAVPTTPAAGSETVTVNRNSAIFLLYEPRPDHPDTLLISINGQVDNDMTGKTWSASALVMEGGGSDSVGIVPITMNQNGSGLFTLTDWKEKKRCILVVTNASANQNRVTVKINDFIEPPDTTPNTPLNIYPNVVRVSSRNPVLISGNHISEIRIMTADGKFLGYYNGDNTRDNAFRKVENGVEWYPNRRLIPGVLFISATSQNPVSNRRNTQRRKVMLLP
jgi:hypothetical protein